MTGPGLLTMLMFLALALVAYAQAAPHGLLHERAGYSSRASAAACPPGLRYSPYYRSCTHAWVQTEAQSGR